MKMKKSLLIVPAMATMLLAAAGSVGGTVAWFSANTTFSTNISSFKVVRLNGDLTCNLAEGYGTDLDTTTTPATPFIKLENYAELTHGSFDHDSGRVYTSNRTGVYTHKGTIAKSGGTTTNADDLQAGKYTEGENTHVVWNAVTWHMTFVYQVGVTASTAPKTNLYFDLASSNIFDVAAYKNNDKQAKTSKGFRIAFFPDENSTATTTDNLFVPHVWAGAYTDTAGTYKYVKYTEGGNPETASTAYTGNVLLDEIAATKTAAAKVDASSGSTSANNYMGQFVSFTDGQSKITFTCVAWFEGEDVNVINDAAMESLSVSLAFFTLPNA